MLERRTTGVERSEKIDVDYRLERVRRHAQRRCRKISRCTTNDYIDLSELLASCRNRGGKHVVVSNIRGKSGCYPTAFGDTRRCSVELLLCPPDEPDFRAMLGIPLRDCEIDPAASAG